MVSSRLNSCNFRKMLLRKRDFIQVMWVRKGQKYSQRLNFATQTSVLVPSVEEVQNRKAGESAANLRFFMALLSISSRGMECQTQDNFLLKHAFNFISLRSIPLSIAKQTQLQRCR
jgi:hypothetical protein